MNKNPHFYCIESSLGTINYPHGTEEDNSGVAGGCKAILTPSFLKNFSNISVHEIKFPKQSFSNDLDYFKAIVRQYDSISNLIKTTLDGPKELQVVVGGDHSVSYSAIGSILERKNPKEIGVIMFDSHADFCLKDNSPSGNFYGMWVRPLIDKFDIDLIDKKIPKKIPSKNWMYVGDLEGEPYFDKSEAEFIREKQITYISKELLVKDFSKAKIILEKFINGSRNIYVTFDIDVYHKSIAPATGISGQWGLNNKAIPLFLKTIADSGKIIGADIMEVNPEKAGADKTIKAAQDVLLQLLKR